MTLEYDARKPKNASEREAIVDECRRILVHPSFRTSRRCVLLFSHLVSHALEGRLHAVKERTLGVQVFGRHPAYNSSLDPVVRMAANEIRKRLAQVYLAELKQPPVRIQLMPGSYLPHFEFLTEFEDEPAEAAPAEAPAPPPDPVPTPPIPAPAAELHPRWPLLVATAGVLLLCLMGWFAYRHHLSTAQESIWAPLLAAKEPVLLSVADDFNASDPALAHQWPEKIVTLMRSHQLLHQSPTGSAPPTVALAESRALAWITGYLMLHRHQNQIRGSSSLTPDELRHSPTVLLGAFDNPWFLMLQSNLRFRLMADPKTQTEWIEDSHDPGNRQWSATAQSNPPGNATDYALLSRFRAPETGTWILALGGTGTHATELASQLITLPEDDPLLPTWLRNYRGNLQIVLRASADGSHLARPEVVAIHTW